LKQTWFVLPQPSSHAPIYIIPRLTPSPRWFCAVEREPKLLLKKRRICFGEDDRYPSLELPVAQKPRLAFKDINDAMNDLDRIALGSGWRQT
jgi:hypothetical protein